MAENAKLKTLNRPTNRPFLYSVNVQTVLMYLCTVFVILMAPFPISTHENDHLNFIHDFVYEQLDRIQVNGNRTIAHVIILFILVCKW